MPKLHETIGGQRLISGTLPSIARSLKKMADQNEVIIEALMQLTKAIKQQEVSHGSS